MLQAYYKGKQSSYTGISAIPVSKCGYIIILAFVYYLLFAPIAYLPDRSIIKYGMILIVGLFVLYNIKVILQKKYLSMNILLLLFVVVCFISSIINRNTISSRDPFLASIVYMGTLVEALLVFEILAEKEGFSFIINILYRLTIFTVIITDFLIFFVPTLFSIYGHNYLVGTKFGVAYLHVQLIVLLFLRRTTKLYKTNFFYVLTVLYSALAVFISIYVDCMTGVMLTSIFLLVYFIFYRIRRALANPVLIVVVLLIFCVMLLINSAIMENEYVQNFIINIFERSPTMTGRTRIFEHISYIMAGHWALGYGYGSAYEITMELIGAPNVQNGLLNWCLECGIFAAILIIAMLFNSFRKVKYCDKELYPVVVILYSFCIIASIEVCISGQFFTWMFFVFVYSTYTCHLNYKDYKTKFIKKRCYDG